MGAGKEVINGAAEGSAEPKWLAWVEANDQMCLWREWLIAPSVLGQNAVAAAAEIDAATAGSSLL